MDPKIKKTIDKNSVTPIYLNELFRLQSRKIDGISLDASLSEAVERQNSRCVVGGIHAFVLKICSFVGLAPLRFEAHGEGYQVTISRGMCIYSYLMVTFLVICTLLGLVAELRVGVEKSVRLNSRMTQVVLSGDVLVIVGIAGAGVYGAPTRMRNMMEYMNSIVTVDKQLGGQYSAKTERHLCAILLVIFVFLISLLLEDSCFYTMQGARIGRQWEMVKNYFCFYLLYIIVIVLELQFAFTALSLRARFQMFNEALNVTASQICKPAETPNNSHVNIYAMSMGPTCRRPNALSDTINVRKKDSAAILTRTAHGPRLLIPSSEAIVRLSKLRCTLFDVVRYINNGYGLPLITNLISIQLHLIITPYFFITEIMVSKQKEQVHFLVLQVLWFSAHMVRMLVMVEPCHYTLEECKRTENILCRITSSTPPDGSLQMKLELFSRQLMLQRICYSPLGLCNLDRPLVTSVLGAVTTYLVILMQFQKSDPT